MNTAPKPTDPGMRAVYNPDWSRRQLYETPKQLVPYDPNNLDGIIGGLGKTLRSSIQGAHLPSILRASTPVGGAGLGAAIGGGLGALAAGAHNLFSDSPISTSRAGGLSAILGGLMGLWRQQIHKRSSSDYGDDLLQILGRLSDVPHSVKATMMYIAQHMSESDKTRLMTVLRASAGAITGAGVAHFMGRMGLLPAAIGFALGGTMAQPMSDLDRSSTHSNFY